MYERKEFIENNRIINETLTTISGRNSSKSAITSIHVGDKTIETSNAFLDIGPTEDIPLSLLDIKEGGSDANFGKKNVQQPSTSVDHEHNDKLEVSSGSMDKIFQAPSIIPESVAHKYRHDHTKHDGQRGAQSHVYTDKNSNIPTLPDIKNLHPLPKLPSLPTILSSHPRIRMGPSAIAVPSVFEWFPKSWNPVSFIYSSVYLFKIIVFAHSKET